MSSRPWGYRSGPLVLREYKMDSAGAGGLDPGDFVIAGTAGYVQIATAGDKPLGVAYSVGTDPSADGDTSVLVSIDPNAIYEYPPDAGSVSQGLVSTTMDIGGPDSIDIDASADDIIVVMGVNIDRNTLFVKLIPTYAGVA